MEFTQEQKLYSEIVQKAWEDPQFKRDLVDNPIEAIEKATGQKLKLSQGKRIVVRDQTEEGTIYINIPAKPNSQDIELNEEQLENAAGGVIDGQGGGCIPYPDIFKPKSPWSGDIILTTH